MRCVVIMMSKSLGIYFMYRCTRNPALKNSIAFAKTFMTTQRDTDIRLNYLLFGQLEFALLYGLFILDTTLSRLITFAVIHPIQFA